MPSLPAEGLQGIISVLAGLGTFAQLSVLAVLLFASVICWGIIFHKIRAFRKARRHTAKFLRAVHSTDDLALTAAAARRYTASPLARFFRAVHQRLEVLHDGRLAGSDDGDVPFAPARVERVRHMLRLAQTEELTRLERGLPFLATTASVAPFIGLFGTVWGIMQSFHAIGQRGGASLAVVGPGISEALVATAAGLAAAIPAVVAYNHFLSRIRRVEGELDNFAEGLVLLFESHLLEPPQQVSNRTPLRR